jgi:hypothetical protein
VADEDRLAAGLDEGPDPLVGTRGRRRGEQGEGYDKNSTSRHSTTTNVKHP